jgi:hypothetical protein
MLFALSAFLYGPRNAGLVAGRGVLVQNPFQDSTIDNAVGRFQAFSADSLISTSQYLFDCGTDGGFERNVALAIPLGHFNTFFS